MHTCGSISIIIVPGLRDKEKRLNRDIFFGRLQNNVFDASSLFQTSHFVH